jgi:hypothetical protein
MATKTSTDTGWVEATVSFVFVLGARNPEWRKVVVRNNRTGQLDEVSLQGEEDPIDEGDPGRTFIVAKGELFPADAEVVQHKPQNFRPALLR